MMCDWNWVVFYKVPPDGELLSCMIHPDSAGWHHAGVFHTVSIPGERQVGEGRGREPSPPGSIYHTVTGTIRAQRSICGAAGKTPGLAGFPFTASKTQKLCFSAGCHLFWASRKILQAVYYYWTQKFMIFTILSAETMHGFVVANKIVCWFF